MRDTRTNGEGLHDPSDEEISNRERIDRLSARMAEMESEVNAIRAAVNKSEPGLRHRVAAMGTVPGTREERPWPAPPHQITAPTGRTARRGPTYKPGPEVCQPY